MKWIKNKYSLWAVGILIVISITFIGLKLMNSGDFYTISDQSNGLAFNMSKNFLPIPREELAALNPGFTYGYYSSYDKGTKCVLAQSKLDGRGSTTAKELQDGLLKEVKKNHPDAKVVNESNALKPIKFGKATGILLEILYTEGKSSIQRVEVIALGSINQVTAYCEGPQADNQRNYKDFSIFFSSLRLD